MIERHDIPMVFEMARVVPAAIEVAGLGLRLGDRTVLDGVGFELPERGITALIGPSGAGKSTLLRCIDRIEDGWTGSIRIAGKEARHWPGGQSALRRHVGLIGQRPCVFPGSIAANVVFGLPWRQRRWRHASSIVEHCLRQAALWDEVWDRLDMPAADLSLGQQQRLCLGRALAVTPRILLLDEPTASLDPRSRGLIEGSLQRLAADVPLLLVTHDLDQARRLADAVVFLCEGRVIEAGPCQAFFDRPERIESREFIQWQVCDCD